jgi:hypothetical protein
MNERVNELPPASYRPRQGKHSEQRHKDLTSQQRVFSRYLCVLLACSHNSRLLTSTKRDAPASGTALRTLYWHGRFSFHGPSAALIRFSPQRISAMPYQPQPTLARPRPTATWLPVLGAIELSRRAEPSLAFRQRAAASAKGIAMALVIGCWTAQPGAMYSSPCRLPQADDFREADHHLYHLGAPMILAPLTPKSAVLPPLISSTTFSLRHYHFLNLSLHQT